MEELLTIQPETTIIEWCKERGVSTISGYYDYLDVLCKPNESEAIQEVLSITDILRYIFGKLYSYSITNYSEVCKTWYEITKEMDSDTTTYAEDAAINLNWYHLSIA